MHLCLSQLFGWTLWRLYYFPNHALDITLKSCQIWFITEASVHIFLLMNQNENIGILLFVSVKVGIGGFSMGAATALYSATCAALGRYGNGSLYPINLRAVVGLSGWLPGSRYNYNWINLLFPSHHQGSEELVQMNLGQVVLLCLRCSFKRFLSCRSVRSKIEGSHEAARRAASLPILICHGTSKFAF